MILPLILLCISVVTHFAFFGTPSAVVFDEVYNGSFVSAYSTHSYYFDIHPPLAKLLALFFGNLIGVPYDIDFSAIGNSLPWGIIMLRLMPVVAGTLLPLIVYFICRRLKLSQLASFGAGILLCVENSLVTHSHFVLFDSTMLLFGFVSVLLYLISLDTKNKTRYIIASTIFSACAFSIKWTGLAFPLWILCIEFLRSKSFSTTLKTFLNYAVAGIIIYTSVFAIHFSLLTHSGPGDAYMSDRFQKSLIGNTYSDRENIEPRGFWGKFIELNYTMYTANKTLTATHMYSSKWYTWPFDVRPIFYWQSPVTKEPYSYIYLLGNPIIYWFGTLSVLFLFFSITHAFLKNRKIALIPSMLFIGYCVNFLPFIFIGRVMFLYHYEAALIISCIICMYILDKIKPQRLKYSTVSSLIIISSLLFIYFAPLTYGLPLNDKQLESRMWLSSWR